MESSIGVKSEGDGIGGAGGGTPLGAVVTPKIGAKVSRVKAN